jgi:hypothetical protein
MDVDASLVLTVYGCGPRNNFLPIQQNDHLSLLKNRHECCPYRFVSEIMHYFFRGIKVAQKYLDHCNFPKTAQS